MKIIAIGENQYFDFPENVTIGNLYSEDSTDKELELSIDDNWDNFDSTVTIKTVYKSDSYESFSTKKEFPISVRIEDETMSKNQRDWVERLYENIYLIIIILIIAGAAAAVARR